MFKLPAPTISTQKSRVVFMLLKAWIVIICVCLCSIILNNTIQESLRLILIYKSSHNSAPQLNFIIDIMQETQKTKKKQDNKAKTEEWRERRRRRGNDRRDTKTKEGVLWLINAHKSSLPHFRFRWLYLEQTWTKQKQKR